MDFAYIPFEPEPPLSTALRGSFFARGQIPYRADKILPNGLAVAVFTIGGPHRVGKSAEAEENPRYDHGWLQGVQTTPIYNMPAGETHVLGLLFEPVGFHMLFGTDMTRLAEHCCDARDVLPRSLVAAIEAVFPHADDEAAHHAVHAALIEHWPAEEPPRWLLDLYRAIVASRGAVRLAPLYDDIGLSPRHIGARFKRTVGVTPKTLARIYRLGALLDAIDPIRKVDWTGLAHQAGFADQAHFNHEFQRFSGTTPGAYLAQRRASLSELGQGEGAHFAPQD